MIRIIHSTKRALKLLVMNQEYNRSTIYFFNNLLYSVVKHGKRFLAIKIFLQLVALIKNRFRRNFLWFFIKIKINLYSKLYLRVQHVGSIPYPIPVISTRKSYFLSKQWILTSLRNRRERTFILKLFSELCDIRNKKGRSLEKKKEYYGEIRDSLPNLRFLRYIELYHKPAYQLPVIVKINNRAFRINKLSKIFRNADLFKKK